jgi:Notch-like protein
MVSCKDAALRKGSAISELCRHSGKCEDIGNSHRCVCAEGIYNLLF